ncbi:MAG: hypothetical protein Satyrvirus20_2 [Satyrvirus sp.]|uniref:Uncharacterized protein n=1 Tax=Satyrvirus sp. TaxID=2487771 RepID=A0A3G5AE46_9VIRU|nr:MAG: hypothetical protein Satyrvirus20_2 [Satyrvirus sp.]
MIESYEELPTKYPESAQKWQGNIKYPYPMNFVQAPADDKQILVYYNGKPMLQGLSINKGPVMFPAKQSNPFRKGAIMYPTTHSIPGPYLQSYMYNGHHKMYPY